MKPRTKILLAILVGVAAATGPVINRLRDLSDVRLATTPTSGDSLTWNGVSWTNSPVAGGGSTNVTYYNTTVTNTLTVLYQIITSNLYTINGAHNTMIITNALTLAFLKTNMLAADANGLVTTVKFGVNISWDPVTQTLSASGGGSASTWVPVTTLAFSTTNVTIPLGGGTNFLVTLTNGSTGFFNSSGAPASASTNTSWTVTVVQDSTGTRAMNWDTTVFKFMGAVVPVCTTNANAIDVFTLTSSPVTAGKVLVTWNPDFR